MSNRKTAKATAEKPSTKFKKMFFETGFRLKKDEKEALQKKGLHVYSRRDNGRKTTIEPSVAVDFMGTLVTNFPIRFPKTGPDANTIWDGDAYLSKSKAECVHKISDLKARKAKPKKPKR